MRPADHRVEPADQHGMGEGGERVGLAAQLPQRAGVLDLVGPQQLGDHDGEPGVVPDEVDVVAAAAAEAGERAPPRRDLVALHEAPGRSRPRGGRPRRPGGERRLVAAHGPAGPSSSPSTSATPRGRNATASRRVGREAGPDERRGHREDDGRQQHHRGRRHARGAPRPARRRRARGTRGPGPRGRVRRTHGSFEESLLPGRLAALVALLTTRRKPATPDSRPAARARKRRCTGDHPARSAFGGVTVMAWHEGRRAPRLPRRPGRRRAADAPRRAAGTPRGRRRRHQGARARARGHAAPRRPGDLRRGARRRRCSSCRCRSPSRASSAVPR